MRRSRRCWPVLLSLLHAEALSAEEASSRHWQLRASSYLHTRSSASAAVVSASAHIQVDGAKLTAEQSKAVGEINAKALAAYQALDEVVLGCIHIEHQRKDELVAMMGEITQLRASLAENTAMRSLATATARSEKDRREALKANVDSMKRQCDDQLASSRKERAILESDFKKAKRLNKLAGNCGTSLLQSWRSGSGGASAGGSGLAGAAVSSAIEAERSAAKAWSMTLHRGATMLQSRFSRSAFHEALRRTHLAVDAAAKGLCADGGAEMSLASVNRTHSAEVWPGNSPSRGTQEKYSQQACKQADHYNGMKGAQRCAAFTVELRRMLAGIESQLKESQVMQERLNDDCTAQSATEGQRLQAAEQRQVQASEDLSRSLADLGVIAAGRDAKMMEQDNAEKALKEERKSCAARVARLKAEWKDTLTLRKQLAPDAQDCMVSEWTWSACSQKCTKRGGRPGSSKGVRTMQSPPSEHGMQCPPLEARVPCGSQPCPQDCKFNAWEEWTSCTATCGGGTQTRVRAIVSQAQHGGAACPPAEDRRVCNIGACNKRCRLGKWSKWGRCSRACRVSEETPAGRRVKTRAVVAPAVGTGSCPDETAHSRMRTGRCNRRLCRDNAKCVGQDTVLVVLDGSDSSNFTAQVALTKDLVSQASPKMPFGVIAYGSEAKIVAPITTDRSSLLKALSSAAAPGGPPDLAQGAALAKNIFLPKVAVAGSGGADQLPGIVLVFTDGAPTDFEASITVAADLRSMGLRLIVGTANQATSKEARKQTCALVGRPCAGNVEAFQGWEELPGQHWRFLSSLCENLEGGDQDDSSMPGLSMG